MLSPSFPLHLFLSRNKMSIPQLLEHSSLLAQEVRAIPRSIYQIGKVVLQSLFIAALVDIFQNLNHDGRIPISIEVDLLVVWHFAYLTAQLWLVSRSGCART